MEQRSLRAPVLVAPALVLAVTASACGGPPRASLQRPDARAVFSERAKAYERLRPAGRHDVVALNNGVPVGGGTNFLILGDGQRVYLAEDLEPVVEPDSATGRYVREAASHRSRAGVAAWIWAGSLVASAVLFAAGIEGGTDDQGRPAPSGSMLTAAGGATIVSLVASGFTWHHLARAHDARAAAFLTYEQSLRESLDICVDGTQIFDCRDDLDAGAETAAAHEQRAQMPIEP